MLDVHPPHGSAHSWRDFFIHIATITVGLLIAVGLEQTIEAVHRHKERAEVRESLTHESEQIIHDCARVEGSFTAELEWNNKVRGVLIEAAANHKPLGIPPPFPHLDFDEPDDPIYKAAKASDKLLLLTEQETTAFNELHGLLIDADHAYQQQAAALSLALETQDQLDFDQATFRANPHHRTNPFYRIRRSERSDACQRSASTVTQGFRPRCDGRKQLSLLVPSSSGSRPFR